MRNYIDVLLGVPWKKKTKVRRDLKRAEGCNMDNTMIADKFRAWCAGRGLALDARNIERAFSDFCGIVGRA